MTVFFMRLLYRLYIQDLYRFIVFINPVKSSPGSSDLQTIQNEIIFQVEFFFIPPLATIRIHTERDKFCLDDPPALFVKNY